MFVTRSIGYHHCFHEQKEIDLVRSRHENISYRGYNRTMFDKNRRREKD